MKPLLQEPELGSEHHDPEVDTHVAVDGRPEQRDSFIISTVCLLYPESGENTPNPVRLNRIISFRRARLQYKVMESTRHIM